MLFAVLVGVCSLQAQPQAGNQNRDWAGLTVYGSGDAELAPPAPGENRVVFLGDSITATWEQCDPKFFSGHSYIDRGIENQTTAQMLVRFRQDVVELQPKVVVIQGGLNDLAGASGPGTDGTVADNLLSMIDIAKQHGIRAVIASLTPTRDLNANQGARMLADRIVEANETLRDVAKDTGSVYLNYYSVLVDPATRQMKKNLSAGGVIPNDSGYAAMAPQAEKAIADALARP